MAFPNIQDFVSLFLSSVSIIVVVLGFGLKETIGFTEKAHILKIKKETEEKFRSKLKIKWEELISKYKEPEEIGSEALEEFLQFGEDAYICQLPSLILNKIGDQSEKIMKYFVRILIGIFLIILGYIIPSLQLTITPDQISLLRFLIVVFGILLATSNIDNFRIIVPELIQLRRSFLELSDIYNLEDATFLKMQMEDKGYL